jgi:hypothetical protein
LLNKRASTAEMRESGMKGFLARRLQGVPVRTLGKLKIADCWQREHCLPALAGAAANERACD